MDNIYVMSIEARSGKTLAALGLMELASRRVERVGFFRPVIRDGDQPDPIIELMRARYGLAEGPERLYGLRYADARELAESGRRDVVTDRDDNEGIAPLPEHAHHREPEDAVPIVDVRPAHASLVHGELMPEGDVLQHELRAVLAG